MKSTTSRETSTLAPLAVHAGRFRGFGKGQVRQDQIYDALVMIARAERTEEPMRFFSMREVCAHFGVSLWTAVAVYRRMEREGLLARIRGVGTVLAANSGRTRPRVPVRGIVAVINWLPGFLHGADNRHFVMQLEKFLWERGFSSALVFYHEEEKHSPDFADRILRHHPDFAIWLTPGPADVTTMKTLGDAGVRVVAIDDQRVETRAPKYTISYRRGLEAALRAWREKGIDRVVVPIEPHRTRPVFSEIDIILNELKIAATVFSMKSGSMEQYVSRLAAQPAGVVFSFSIWHSQVCAQAPQAFVRLLAQRPVLNCWLLPIAADVLGTVRTDAVLFPWDQMARRIANDLHSGDIFRMTEDVVIHAEWKPRVLAAHISRLYAYERVE